MSLNKMVIGIPKEIMKGETRVSATPETVKKMVDDGAVVFVEKGAGNRSFLSDGEYEECGGRLVDGAKTLYECADVVLKVQEPQFNGDAGAHETEMMRKGQYLITFLHPACPANAGLIRSLAEKGVISLTLDGVPRIARAQSMDAFTSMSTVAGYQSMFLAANHFPRLIPMVSTAVGMVKPANVMVVGAGVAGLQAAATAKRMGAAIHAVDIRPEACEQIRSLGVKAIETDIPAEAATGEGGGATRLADEWLEKETALLADKVKEFDILILSAHIFGKKAPLLITEKMAESMRPGSVIVDLSADQGGNCAVTIPGETIERAGVVIDGTTNVPALLPVSSTWMFSQNAFNFLTYFAKDGGLALDMSDEIAASVLVTRDGEVVHAGAKEALDL